MILYITSKQNNAIFDKQIEEKGEVPITKEMGNFELNSLLNFNNTNLNYLTHLIVDLSALTGSEDETLRAIRSFRTMYRARVIIVAIGYEAGNYVLSKLFEEGIYDFVTAIKTEEQAKEIASVLNEGMTYQDSVKYHIEPKTKKGKGKSEKVVVKEIHKKVRQMITVGVIGTQHRVGTTTQALLLTRYLIELGYKACYVNATGSDEISSLSEFYSTPKNDGVLTISGMNIYYDNNGIGKAVNSEYEFVVFDDGVFNGSLATLLQRDIKIVVSGAKAWECSYLGSIFSSLADISQKVNFILSFVDESEQNDIKNMMGPYKKDTYFSQYACLPFFKTANRTMYNDILKDYIEPEQIVSDKKVKKFPFFK